jgi:hypothetical protein
VRSAFAVVILFAAVARGDVAGDDPGWGHPLLALTGAAHASFVLYDSGRVLYAQTSSDDYVVGRMSRRERSALFAELKLDRLALSPNREGTLCIDVWRKGTRLSACKPPERDDVLDAPPPQLMDDLHRLWRYSSEKVETFLPRRIDVSIFDRTNDCDWSGTWPSSWPQPLRVSKSVVLATVSLPGTALDEARRLRTGCVVVPSLGPRAYHLALDVRLPDDDSWR